MENLTLAGALNSLDVENDEHWTKTGLPKLKAIKELTGNDELTTSMVKERLPEGFDRISAPHSPDFYEPSPEDGGNDEASDDGDVLFECAINNIWTSRGKVVFGKTIMLPPDEVKFLKACQQMKLKKVMEA